MADLTSDYLFSNEVVSILDTAPATMIEQYLLINLKKEIVVVY